MKVFLYEPRSSSDKIVFCSWFDALAQLVADEGFSDWIEYEQDLDEWDVYSEYKYKGDIYIEDGARITEVEFR